jgi:hypothetical protein
MMAIEISQGNQTDEDKQERKAKRKLKGLRQSVKKANFDALANNTLKFEALREAVETLLLAQKDSD